MPMMGYSVSKYYKLKEDKYLKTKIGSLEFFTDDIFTKSEDGTYTVHTGICMFGIEINSEDLEYCEGIAKLVGI